MPPLLLTFVARLSDGLPLVASYAQTTENLDEQKWQAKEILRNLDSRYVVNIQEHRCVSIFHSYNGE